MTFREILWNGFSGVEFEFLGLPATVIRPNVKPTGKWALKTEYKDAFPDTEIELLNRGFHVAFNQNFNRWAEWRDLERKAEFIKFVSEIFDLNEKCVLVGMSCGGMYAVKLAAICPERIEALYLDAPVMNLLSCPAGMGVGTDVLFDEFFSFTGISKVDLLSYRDNPIDKMDILLRADIPIVLVAGDSDVVVPYHENGEILEKYYKERGGRIKVHIKQDCGHHPHGLADAKIVATEIIEYCGFSENS